MAAARVPQALAHECVSALWSSASFPEARTESQFVHAYRTLGLRYALSSLYLAVCLSAGVACTLFVLDDDGVRATQRVVIYSLIALFLFLWCSLLRHAREWSVRAYPFAVGFPVTAGILLMSSLYVLRVETDAAPWTHGPSAIIFVLFLTASFTRLPTALVAALSTIGAGIYIIGMARASEPLFPATLYLALTVVASIILNKDIERRERAVFSQLLASASLTAAKSRVLASVSHDLRQPLGALSLYLESLCLHGVSSDTTRLNTTLHRMSLCVQAMEGNLSRLLEIGRLQSDSTTVASGPVDLADLFERLHSVYALQAASSQIELRTSAVSADARWVISNGSCLFEVLSNLIHNALKFTQRHRASGGCVLLYAERLGNQIRIYVRDNGPGIARADQVRIFDEYVQIGNSERDHRKGYGLGLAVVRQLVSSMDGHEVELQSSLGNGSQFSVTANICIEPPSVPGLGRESDRAEAYNFAGRLVLLVEDDVLVRHAIAETLRLWNVEVESATSAADARALARESDIIYDAILTDWRLPDECTGADVIAVMRDAAGMSIPAVVITGELLIDDRAPFELPVDSFLLRKPLGWDDLSNALQRAFARSDALRAAVEADS